MLRINRMSTHLLAPVVASAGSLETVTVEVRDKGVAIVTINRPKALNALNQQVLDEVLPALKSLDQDGGVRAIILTGSGDKAFVAGADIKMMNSLQFAEVVKMDMFWAWQQMREIRKPIIAAINGFALGGGCEVAMLCDIIIASDKARFGQPEITLGTIPGMGGTQRLTRAVGKSKAMEWILSGKQFSAEEAERAGLVSRVVPHAQLLPEALALAERIGEMSVPVVAAAKEAVLRAYESSLSEGLLFEKRAFYSTWAVADRAEGMTAFAEKRAAKFQDR